MKEVHSSILERKISRLSWNWLGYEKNEWDLILVEDLSRQHPAAIEDEETTFPGYFITVYLLHQTSRCQEEGRKKGCHRGT